MRIGVIGFGDFGRLCVKHLSKAALVVVSSRSESNSEEISSLGGSLVSLEELARSSDIIVLAVPLAGFEGVLEQICPLMPDGALLVDTCSVKLEPRRLMLKYARPGVGILATHPLFGPQTATDSVSGHKIVIDPVRVTEPEKVIKFLEELGLEVIQLSADEHDREMAWVHALTFFVGRGVSLLNPPESKLGTNYYGELMDLVELDRSQSEDLFMTIERGNPYAVEMRQRFVRTLRELEIRIESES